MLEFGWIAERPAPPEVWDLRRAGWCMVTGGRPRSELSSYPLLVRFGTPFECLSELVGREWIILLGVNSGDERARLIGKGFADALDGSVRLPELAARTRRVATAACKVPRQREVGPVTLDLRHRDAMVAGRWVGLFPREFELFWRLAERGGERVTRRQLLKDVWRLNHDPETNRVEVHISRLRSKLSATGADNLICTDRAGGYRVVSANKGPVWETRDELALDAYTRRTNSLGVQEEGLR